MNRTCILCEITGQKLPGRILIDDPQSPDDEAISRYLEISLLQ